jgi:FkbM family methyltransferase
MNAIKRRLIRFIPNLPMTMKLRSGGSIRYPARACRGLLIRNIDDYEHERAILAYDGEYVRPEMTVFDIGANIGIHTVRIGRLLGHGQITSFEPDETNLKWLEENISRNGIGGRVTIVPKAVDETSGFATFYEDQETRATGTIVPQDGNTMSHRLAKRPPKIAQVATTSIDDYCLKGDRRILPDLIKIDVEGAEARVLRGARQTIQTARPQIIVDGTPAEAAGILHELGYTLYDLVANRRRVREINDVPLTVLASGRL